MDLTNSIGINTLELRKSTMRVKPVTPVLMEVLRDNRFLTRNRLDAKHLMTDLPQMDYFFLNITAILILFSCSWWMDSMDLHYFLWCLKQSIKAFGKPNDWYNPYFISDHFGSKIRRKFVYKKSMFQNLVFLHQKINFQEKAIH